MLIKWKFWEISWDMSFRRNFSIMDVLWNFTDIFSCFLIKNFKKLWKNFESIIEKFWSPTNRSPPPSPLHRNVILLYGATAKFRFKIYDNCNRKVYQHFWVKFGKFFSSFPRPTYFSSFPKIKNQPILLLV